jgi:quinoprotein glucose dehydrogenase
MKSLNPLSTCLVACLCLSLTIFVHLDGIAQRNVTYYGQTFKIDTLYPATGSTGMNSPWEVLYGPDDSLWVTASHDYKIWKIHPGNKGSRLLLDMNSLKDFTAATANPWPQGGLMGMAIHPGFFTGKPWIYIAYVYHLISCSAGSGGEYCSYNTKIVRYSYNSATGTLTYMNDVITGLDGSNDHNSGRLRISPLVEADGKYHLYYSLGDMGAGNLANVNRPNYAQDTLIVEGKILRLNTEPDLTLSGAQQWIPGNNPFPAGAPPAMKSPIYSYGHRNPQGLVFGSVNGGSSYILYSSEHGDESDDEVNIIMPHTNYGWPKVAGLCDDNYSSTTAPGDSMYLANKLVISEKGVCDTMPVQEPIFSFYNWSRTAIQAAHVAPSNMYWGTIAPASIAFYGAGAIPNWNYSLLIPSLKNGLFRLKLKADGLSIDSTQLPYDTLHYLKGYRLRNITVAPTGDTLFVAVDNSCCTLGPSGVIGNSVATPAPGFILRLVYLNTLALPDSLPGIPQPPAVPVCKIYPNPAHQTLYIQGRPGEQLPWLVTVYDMLGRPVLQRESTQNNFSLDIQHLSPGIYACRMWNGYGAPVLTEKILIQ